MKTLLIILLALPSVVFALEAKHNKKPPRTPNHTDIECESTIPPGRKQINIICKTIGKDRIKPGDVIEFELEINTSYGYPPEAV